jgi:hypothetical protein
MDEVRKKGKGPRIKTGRMKKADLRRQIRRREGNFEFFGKAKDYCGSMNCHIRENCLHSNKINQEEA